MKQTTRGIPLSQNHRIPRNYWDRAPWNRWTFQNIRQLLPTTEVWRGNGDKWVLPEAKINLENLGFVSGNSPPTTIDAWLDSSFTDGFLVLHKGEIVFERYMNGMTERTLHLSQSMAKSIVGSVAGILMGKGLLDANARVTRYLPELKKTAWKGATLQQVMDMTTGVKYVEDYEAPDSDISVTDVASGWRTPPPETEFPECIWEQILGLVETTREHGTLFQYRSIETDVLAHCMERATGTHLAELISDELWQPLGCEESACFTVDRAGYPLADGGFNATLRDYARFGQMLLQQGMANGRQIVPAEWIKDIHNTNGDLFHAPYNLATPNGSYRNQFWIEDVNRKAFMARGVFGQKIYVDPEHHLTIVKLSSWPEFTSDERLRTALDAIHAIARTLNPVAYTAI